jgi:hypothetical protein
MRLATSDEILKEIGARLKLMRLARPLLQKEVAARANMSVLTVQRIESGLPVATPHMIGYAIAVGGVDSLKNVFLMPEPTLWHVERHEQLAQRERARRKK